MFKPETKFMFFEKHKKTYKLDIWLSYTLLSHIFSNQIYKNTQKLQMHTNLNNTVQKKKPTCMFTKHAQKDLRF